MDELIAKLEAASEGNSDLDRDIECCLYSQNELLIRRDKWECKKYTTSLDAAFSLIPEKYGWALDYMDPGEPDGACVGQHVGDGYSPDFKPRTPALALCIAALKARQFVSERTET